LSLSSGGREMTNIRPRRIAHKGRVDAAGFVFNSDLIGVTETRMRILNLWETGAQVFSDGPDYFVRLPSSVRVECRHSVATPLVQIESVLSAIPLSPHEVEMLQAPSHSVVLSKGGVAYVKTLSSASAESPESWLDVAGFKVVEVKSLGAAFAEPKVVAEPQPFEAREKLDGVPAEASELRGVIAAIKSATSAKQPSDTGGAEALRSWFGSVIGSIAAQIGNLLSRQSSTPLGITAERSSDQGRLSGWLNRVAMRLLHTSGLARLLGRRQAEYLGKMMDMFERGDINEALKHAIPLSDLSSLNQQPAFGVPSPRDSLLIRPWQGVSSRTIGLQTDFMAHLHQLYRSTFERLVAQKRIEEAAFVLAELLRANEEAVAFLERHGKLRLAAELAEARELPPGIVVRQWFIAGDIKRAVGIARRKRVFADAVLRLEKTDKKQAQKLRLVWADSLAEGGNYAGAVDVIWPIESERVRAREWMDRAIETGGPVAGRMLARKLTIVPGEFDDIRRRALTFLEDESFEQQETRASFAQALSAGENTVEARTLARVTARAILRDAGQNASSLTNKHFNRLINFASDGPLRTDVPPFPSEREQHVERLLSLEWAAADCGSMPVHDAVLLPNGRMLVALGEIGVRLLTRDGRTVTHFDQPAEKLVISDNGDRAIALARRGEVWRLTRLDVIDWRYEEWCDAPIDAFAPNYDGSLWFVGSEGNFYAIDAHSKSFEAFWRVPDAGHRVLDVARTESSCSFLTTSKESAALELWGYLLPLLTLRYRAQLPFKHENVVWINPCHAVSAEGIYVDQSLYFTAEPSDSGDTTIKPLPSLSLRVFAREVEKFEFAIGDESSVPLVPEVLGRRIVSPVLDKDVLRVRVFDIQSKDGATQLLLSGATQLSTRLTETTLTVTDNLGRVIVIDLRRNCLLRNLRI
jgi:MoxR-vWA-beta-propeller ternary system domain bpX6